MPQQATPPSIADYALVGDCRTAALVSRDGSIDWLCLPSFSSPSVFARLLDPAGGHVSLRPVGPYTVTRRYLDGTAVLETVFETPTGSARLLDCLPVLDGIDETRPLREVLRIVEGLSGTTPLRVEVDPRPDYARRRARLIRRRRLGWFFTWGDEVLQIGTDIDLSEAAGALAGEFALLAGGRRALSLSYSRGEPAVIPPLGPDADARVADTAAWWRDWSGQVVYEGIHRQIVVRSAITLKLLSHAPSGAIVAAPTTSLPEAIGGDRNWDYRYCWLRDAGLTMQALLGLGIDEDAGAFLEWMLHATRLTAPHLRIMYDIYGRSDLVERDLPHLAGYRGSRPVRIGNGAFRQQQTDTYGEVILAASSYAAQGGAVDAAGARMLRGLGRVVRRTWRGADSGIWEMRGPERQFTFSKLMCWAALDRLLALDAQGAIRLGRDRAATEAERDTIADLIEARGYNEAIAAYTGELDGDWVDASLLLMPAVGYRPADDPRVVSTWTLCRERLGRGGLFQRYEAGVDGMEGDEGAFGICSFWAIEQLARRGETAEAEHMFAHLLSFGNDLGLFAEEIDGRTGEALGNFPQAFTHVGLINVALALRDAAAAGTG